MIWFKFRFEFQNSNHNDVSSKQDSHLPLHLDLQLPTDLSLSILSPPIGRCPQRYAMEGIPRKDWSSLQCRSTCSRSDCLQGRWKQIHGKESQPTYRTRKALQVSWWLLEPCKGERSEKEGCKGEGRWVCSWSRGGGGRNGEKESRRWW